MMQSRKSGRIVQNAYVVADLDVACARFNSLFGIGPFIGGTPFELANHVYRGVPADPIRLRGVFVQSGDLNIELIQILSPGPCAFTDMFAAGAQGMHHSAVFCDDYAATRDHWVAAGCPVVSAFTTPFGAPICYIDARAELGHFIELYPEHPVIRAMYAQAVRTTEEWDGNALMIPW